MPSMKVLLMIFLSFFIAGRVPCLATFPFFRDSTIGRRFSGELHCGTRAAVDEAKIILPSLV